MRSLHCLISFVLLLFLQCTIPVFSSQPPHIIFIIVDDLGWNDVSFHGSKQIPTPNIDALANDGVILNSYYVQPICTPSRGTLMAGKYPIRLGLQHDVIYAEAPWGLSPKEKILPQYLRELGYATRGIGKWHLGYFNESYLPVNRGFDSFFGYWNGKEDFYTHFEEGQGTHGLDFHDDNENAWNYTGHYGTNLFTNKAKTIIENHNTSTPLFLYFAHQAVHAGNSYTPLQAPPEYVKRFSHIKDEDRRIFAAMGSALDDSIGDIFSSLNKTGILQNCIIVFTTDNGAAVEGIDKSTGSNWPLRGSKYNMWEGGIRGSAFLWSTLLREASGKIFNELMHMSDWLPTLYHVAGGDSKKLQGIDGYNQWQSICCNSPSLRNMILYNIDPDWKVEAIRKGKYKLLKGSVFNGNFDGWFDKEGKHKENVPFTPQELETHSKVYSLLANESQVLPILSRVYDSSEISEKSFRKTHKKKTQYCKNPEIFNIEYVKNPDESLTKCVKKPEKNFMRSVEVNCGKRHTDPSSICEPMKASCLFDILNDPCEYNNLATKLPRTVQELEGLLDQYRSQAVPVRNRPLDPASNPKYHGYAWVPWKQDEV
ncbi:hypothetical protein JTE90_010987 [Oedothorax gibbosus]|uniref:Sulfatase N-terminal domain-containing protein n=1 Tax=Oedothorax gibbosus TaxID=931172 RepID=A0AAV6VF86_9ARAC|nr:hypothetical protein JTE90_010987 [Oedothorax gibbosus]